MARLPADGKSVQSRSSGSIQSTPSLSAAPAAEKTTEQDGHETGCTDAGNHMSAKPLTEPVSDAGTTTSTPVLGAHDNALGRIGDEEGQKVESSTSLPSGECASPTPEDALTAPREACPDAHPELQIGDVALNGGASMGRTDQCLHAASVLHEDAKLPDTHGEERPLQVFTTHTPSCVDVVADSCSAVENGGTVTPPPPSVLAEVNVELVAENSEAVTTIADPAAQTDKETTEEPGGGQALAGQERDGETTTPKSPPPEQDRKSDRETDGAQDYEANPEQEDVFIPFKCFNGARPGYVFKTGDKGLGFYVEGYVDEPLSAKPPSSHRPWNAGPGDQAIRRAPLGPIPKPFKKIAPFRTREEKKAAEESDM